MDLGHFQRLFLTHTRQDGGDALGYHGLAAAGLADHEQVVPAGRRHDNEFDQGFLTLDVSKIHTVGQKDFTVNGKALLFIFPPAFQIFNNFIEGRKAEDLYTSDE